MVCWIKQPRIRVWSTHQRKRGGVDLSLFAILLQPSETIHHCWSVLVVGSPEILYLAVSWPRFAPQQQFHVGCNTALLWVDPIIRGRNHLVTDVLFQIKSLFFFSCKEKQLVPTAKCWVGETKSRLNHQSDANNATFEIDEKLVVQPVTRFDLTKRSCSVQVITWTPLARELSKLIKRRYKSWQIGIGYDWELLIHTSS